MGSDAEIPACAFTRKSHRFASLAAARRVLRDLSLRSLSPARSLLPHALRVFPVGLFPRPPIVLRLEQFLLEPVAPVHPVPVSPRRDPEPVRRRPRASSNPAVRGYLLRHAKPTLRERLGGDTRDDRRKRLHLFFPREVRHRIPEPRRVPRGGVGGGVHLRTSKRIRRLLAKRGGGIHRLARLRHPARPHRFFPLSRRPGRRARAATSSASMSRPVALSRTAVAAPLPDCASVIAAIRAAATRRFSAASRTTSEASTRPVDVPSVMVRSPGGGRRGGERLSSESALAPRLGGDRSSSETCRARRRGGERSWSPRSWSPFSSVLCLAPRLGGEVAVVFVVRVVPRSSSGEGEIAVVFVVRVVPRTSSGREVAVVFVVRVVPRTSSGRGRDPGRLHRPCRASHLVWEERSPSPSSSPSSSSSVSCRAGRGERDPGRRRSPRRARLVARGRRRRRRPRLSIRCRPRGCRGTVAGDPLAT